MPDLFVTSVMLGIVVVLAALAALAMLAYVVYYYFLAGWLAPTRMVMAKVVRKQQSERTSGSNSYFPEDGDLISKVDDSLGLIYDFYVVFEFDGKQREFAVPIRVYADIDENDTGLLVHKGNLFRKFIKHATGWSDPVQAPVAPISQ